MLELAAQAAGERSERNTTSFRYTVVLTKADKANKAELKASIHKVQNALKYALSVSEKNGACCGDASKTDVDVHPQITKSEQQYDQLYQNCAVICTSTVEKEGADQIWEVIAKECSLKE